MNFYFHGRWSYRNAEGEWTSIWCSRHTRVWKHNTIIIWIHNVFRAQVERIKKISSLEENFITLAEQFRVCRWENMQEITECPKPVDPWYFPSNPCFSFLLLPSLCPQFGNHLGRLFHYVVASTFSGSRSLKDFKGITCSSTWSWGLPCQASCQDQLSGFPGPVPGDKLSTCFLAQKCPAHTGGIPWKLCKPKMQDV